MGNYTTLEKWVKRHSISICHFDAKQARALNMLAGRRLKDQLWSIEAACTEHSECDRGVVRRLLLKSAVIPYKCSCGVSGDWNGRPISLQLEHKNGIRDDHRLENLEFLCPNCHSQTSTYAGRNKKGEAAPVRNIETKRAKERARVADTEDRVRALLATVPIDLFQGWGAKQRVANQIGLHPGKLIKYIRTYAPEYEQYFTK